MTLVNELLCEHLFMQLVFHALDQAKADHPDLPEKEINDMAFYKVERIGFSMGERIIEKYNQLHFYSIYTMCRLLHKSLNTRLPDQLEAFKFICKEFWSYLFKRQVDNLKTNHRGVYVMQVNDFAWTSRFAASTSDPLNNNLTVLVKRDISLLSLNAV